MNANQKERLKPILRKLISEVKLELKEKNVLKEEQNNRVDSAILVEVKSIARYSDWISDPGRKNTNADVDVYIEKVLESIQEIKALQKRIGK